MPLLRMGCNQFNFNNLIRGEQIIYIVHMKWKEDEGKNYGHRTYSIGPLSALITFLMKYIDNPKIIWIQIVNR